ncbi:MAG: thioredoxin-disulfide reductase [Puniceicoccales bacterium]|jgi:thioredoxin reductase (NADPH)|nr:thioredoxin-disulfide reductase [Puniceicoccales bacterium]
MEDLIIIGTGCAGLTAAIYTARAGLSPLVFEGPMPGGQLTATSEIENFPGFPDGIDGYSLIENMRRQATRFGARFEYATIETLNLNTTPRQLHTTSKTYETRAIIIATGAAPRLLDIPGEKEFFGGKGVSTCATCDGAFYRDMDVAIIGGGDSACEEALFLARFASRVWLVHRRDKLRASEIMARRVLAHAKITPVWNTAPTAILGDDAGLVRAIACQTTPAGQLVEIACKGVFIAIGHKPNTQPFANILPMDTNGYLLTATGSTHTQVAGIFAAGDCADSIYRQAITAAGTGCRAAIEAERWLQHREH